MLIDITLKITPQMVKEDTAAGNQALLGHLGTHFDVMDQEFPLEYTRRKGIVFDVSSVSDRDIGIADVDLDAVEPGMFTAFYTGYIQRIGYGGKLYYSDHPQLSHELIRALLEKGVSVIGLDFAGIRRGKEHVPTDRQCARQGTFVVENLYGLKPLLAHGGRFTAHTYPMSFTQISGLPCRVIAEV